MKSNKINTMVLSAGLLSVLLLSPMAAFASGPRHYKPGFWENVTDKYGKVDIYQGQITGISGSTLSVIKNAVTYTINTDGNTIWYRRYFGIGSESQLTINDLVNIRGSVNGTTVQADFVRDTSIQEYHDTFHGFVTQVNSNGFVMQSVERGLQTVTVDAGTKITDRNGNVISLNQIQVNNTIVLDGIYDHTQHLINQVGTVKDSSLPN